MQYITSSNASYILNQLYWVDSYRYVPCTRNKQIYYTD